MREQVDIAGAECLYPSRSVGARVPRGLEQLAHDLRIGLAIEAYPLHRPSLADLLPDRSQDPPPAGAGGQQDGSVNVEEDESPAGHHRFSGRRTATSRSLRE